MPRSQDGRTYQPDDYTAEAPSTVLLSSSSKSQRIRKRQWSRWYPGFQRLCSDTWFVEAVALTLSSICATCLCVMLGCLDGQPLPFMPKGLTLNAIIAILSTITKSSLILVVSSCINQLKWIWYQHSQKLGDTQLFDNASRGPLGAVQMLIEHRGWSTACLGALILILALLFEPFVQQVVAYPNVSVLYPSDQATANQSRTFLQHISTGGGLPISAKEALEAGLWSSGFDPKPQCPSSDCKWDTFSSLGLCSSCGRSEPLPQLDCDFKLDYPQVNQDNYSTLPNSTLVSTTCNITFREGRVSKRLDLAVQLQGYGGGPMFRLTGPAYGLFEIYGEEYVDSSDGGTVIKADPAKSPVLINDTIQGVKNPLLAVAAVHFNLTNTSLTVTEAEECTLNYCLRDYTMTTTNNTPSTKISNIRNGAGTKLFIDNLAYWCWMAEDQTFSVNTTDSDGREIVSSYWSDAEHFSFCMSAYSGWFSDWGAVIAGRLIGNISQYIVLGCPPNAENSSTCEFGGGTEILDGTDLNTPAGAVTLADDAALQAWTFGFNTIIHNIADSMTKLNLELDDTNVINGTAGYPAIHVQVRWAWLTLPFLLLIAGAVLFTRTVIDTKKHQVQLWKSSVLAFLYHGLEAGELHGRNVAEKVSGMERMAADLKVRLQRRNSESRTLLIPGK